jgi:Type II secretion system (T2SS), protein N
MGTMAATMPLAFAVRLAGVAVPDGVALSGTVWNGKATLLGYRASWDSRGWPSLVARGWVADLQISGPDTALAGQWVLQPGRVTIAPLAGQMGWSLLDAVMPGLEITCTTQASLTLTTATLAPPPQRQATGRVQLAAGTCARRDGTITDVPMPALQADIVTTAEGVGLTLTGVDAPAVPLGNLLITPDDRLRVTVHAAGAALVPGLPASGDSQIELPLALFMQ